LIKKYATWTIPNQPTPIRMIGINRFVISPVASMLSNLGAAAISNSSHYYMFETTQLKMFNQGFVAYEAAIKQRKSYFMASIHDYALVFVDKVHVATLDRSVSTVHNFTVDCQNPTCTLRIVI